MDLAKALGAGARMVFRQESPCELREAALVRAGGEVRVYALCSGEQAWELYDSPWHVGCAVIGNAGAVRLTRLLGAASLESCLVTLLSDGSWMADLLDVLDGEGIPYAYRSIDTMGDLMRAEMPGECGVAVV